VSCTAATAIVRRIRSNTAGALREQAVPLKDLWKSSLTRKEVIKRAHCEDLKKEIQQGQRFIIRNSVSGYTE